VIGSAQADDIKAHDHIDGAGSGGTARYGTVTGLVAAIKNTQSGSATGGDKTSATGGTETRPRNIALLACIKF